MLTFSLPKRKVDNIVSLCQFILQKDRVRLREQAAVLWNFSWSFTYVRSHYRSLQRFYIQSVGDFRDLNKLVTFTKEARIYIQWNDFLV
jgi:hypothetical protein